MCERSAAAINHVWHETGLRVYGPAAEAPGHAGHPRHGGV